MESNTESTPPAPPRSANVIKTVARELENAPELIDFLRQNGVAILIGASVAAAVFLGWSLYRNHRIQQRAAASALLFSAQGADQVQQVLNRYPRTPAAPLAQLIMAGAAFDQGQYDYAHSLFSRFLEEHPDHELRDQAKFAVIQCLEAAGRAEEAHAAYTAFAAERPGHYLEPAARLGAARCLELLGRLDEARAAYVALRDEFTDERWRARAESAIAFVDKEIRARARGDVSSAPAAPAPVFSFPSLFPEGQLSPVPSP
jgi:predicted negative regulator of RcsB-dependent stress response